MRRFIQSSKETIKKIVAERNHGPGCPCNTCYIMEHEGADDAKERQRGSFLIERGGSAKSTILPS